MERLAIILLVGAIGIVVEQALTAVVRLWYASRNAEEVLQRVEVLGREGRIDEARRLAGLLPGSVSTVVLAGLGRPEPDAEVAMKRAIASELRRLSSERHFVDWAAIAAVAIPLAFGAWLRSTDRLGAELGGWLFLVSVGLATAIGAVLIRFWILSRLRRLAVDMEKGALVVYNTAR